MITEKKTKKSIKSVIPLDRQQLQKAKGGSKENTRIIITDVIDS